MRLCLFEAFLEPVQQDEVKRKSIPISGELACINRMILI